jgi:hypothetical protein
MAQGWISVAIPRYVEETAPPHLYSIVAPFFTICYALGNWVAMISGLILPNDTDIPALLISTRWKYIFGFPLPLSFIIFFYLLWGFRCESPKFFLMKKSDVEAHVSIQSIYHTESVE